MYACCTYRTPAARTRSARITNRERYSSTYSTLARTRDTKPGVAAWLAYGDQIIRAHWAIQHAVSLWSGSWYRSCWRRAARLPACFLMAGLSYW